MTIPALIATITPDIIAPIIPEMIPEMIIAEITTMNLDISAPVNPAIIPAFRKKILEDFLVGRYHPLGQNKLNGLKDFPAPL